LRVLSLEKVFQVERVWWEMVF